MRFMADNQILIFQESGEYFINTENFSTNAQISKIGEVLADCICENYLEFDVLTGMHIMGFLFRQWRQVFCITNMEKPQIIVMQDRILIAEGE